MSLADDIRRLEYTLASAQRENRRLRGLLEETLAQLSILEPDPNVAAFIRRIRCDACQGTGHQLRGGRGDGSTWTSPYRVPCPSCQRSSE